MKTQTYARQAIVTKYHGPTNTRGSRVSATSGITGQRLTIEWDHSIGSFANHQAAALALATKLEWTGPWVGGATKGGYCFVDASVADIRQATLQEAYALTLTTEGGSKPSHRIRADIAKVMEGK